MRLRTIKQDERVGASVHTMALLLKWYHQCVHTTKDAGTVCSESKILCIVILSEQVWLAWQYRSSHNTAVLTFYKIVSEDFIAYHSTYP